MHTSFKKRGAFKSFLDIRSDLKREGFGERKRKGKWFSENRDFLISDIFTKKKKNYPPTLLDLRPFF